MRKLLTVVLVFFLAACTQAPREQTIYEETIEAPVNNNSSEIPVEQPVVEVPTSETPKETLPPVLDTSDKTSKPTVNLPNYSTPENTIMSIMRVGDTVNTETYIDRMYLSPVVLDYLEKQGTSLDLFKGMVETRIPNPFYKGTSIGSTYLTTVTSVKFISFNYTDADHVFVTYIPVEKWGKIQTDAGPDKSEKRAQDWLVRRDGTWYLDIEHDMRDVGIISDGPRHVPLPAGLLDCGVTKSTLTEHGWEATWDKAGRKCFYNAYNAHTPAFFREVMELPAGPQTTYWWLANDPENGFEMHQFIDANVVVHMASELLHYACKDVEFSEQKFDGLTVWTWRFWERGPTCRNIPWKNK